MDYQKTGLIIKKLRREQGLTQLALAEKLNISDKAVSKWERGMGCPDVSLLPELSGLLGVDIEGLLTGAPETNDKVAGNMKKLKFYICPLCGNILTANAEASVCCCGKKLSPVEAKKALPEQRLSMERIETEWFVSSGHPMEKEHYISFVAVLTGDTLIFKRMYPEWNMETRLPSVPHGTLLWHCTVEGLFYQYF